MKKYKKTITGYELVKRPSDIPAAQIITSKTAYEYAMQFFHDDIEVYESFFMLTTNRANNVTGFVKISQGGCFGTVVDVKLIAKYAVDSLSGAVILMHNHPSGNIQPSNEDVNLTKKIQQALSLFGIALLDHLIVTPDRYYSFKDEGLL